MDRYQCNACHLDPAWWGPRGGVGPPLAGFASRPFIAGVLPNNPDNLRLWIEHSQSVTPGNAMPDTPMSDQDARDIAAYLYTLD